jgi:catechol 2,3-dioxygenase-like lactoylglutathione lyase family enzyme
MTAAAPISYSHHHLNVTDVAAHRRFWIDALGGTAATADGTESVAFPGVQVLLRQQASTGGTKGSIVNHVAFQVRELRPAVERVKAAGFPIVTREEVRAVPPEAVKDGIAYIPSQDYHIAMTMGPEGTKVELVENPGLDSPIALHHVHFFTPQPDEMRDWYVRTFDAAPGDRGTFRTADLPSVSLTMVSALEPVVGTRGRVLDHLGFEVQGLEALCRRLEANGVGFDQRYARTNSGAGSATFTDPWGTLVELTEGVFA